MLRYNWFHSTLYGMTVTYVNPGVVAIACRAYYDNKVGEGLEASYNKLSSGMNNRVYLGMEGLLKSVLPLVASGVDVHSHQVMLACFEGAFAAWGDGSPDYWSRWVDHYGAGQYDVYEPAFRKVLTAVFGK